MADDKRWMNFKVSSVLSVEQTKSVASKADLTEGNIPYVTRTTSNNGYTRLCGNVDKLNKGHCITIGAETGVAFYQPKDFVAGNKVYRLSCNRNLTAEQYIFLASVLNRLVGQYSYSNARTMQRIKEEMLPLPVVERNPNFRYIYIYTTDDIDWQYMHDRIVQMEHDRIVQMEHDRIVELNAYLLASKLDDYELTNDDKKVLSDGNKAFQNFEIQDVFEKIETPKIKAKANDFPTERSGEYNIPLLTASVSNQGLARYAKASDCPLVLKNCISLSTDGDAGTAFYQPDNFAVLQSSCAMRVIDHEIANTEEGLYIAAVLNKSIRPAHNYVYKAGWEKIKTDLVAFPVIESSNPNHTYTVDDIDWQHMQHYIRAIEKLTVANVVQYKDKVIETTKQAIRQL